MTQRTLWIVDGSYLYKSSSQRFDYLLLKKELQNVLRTSFYESYFFNSVQRPPADGQDSFHSWLKLAPPQGPQMRVMLYSQKDLRSECPACGHKYDRQVQKGVDVAIATTMMKLAFKDRFDRLVLSAGDGDFEEVVDYIKTELGKGLVLAGFRDTVSPDLQCYADQIIWIDRFLDKIAKPANNQGERSGKGEKGRGQSN